MGDYFTKNMGNPPVFPRLQEGGGVRDFFAAAALPAVIGTLAEKSAGQMSPEEFKRFSAAAAFGFADACLEERSKGR